MKSQFNLGVDTWVRCRITITCPVLVNEWHAYKVLNWNRACARVAAAGATLLMLMMLVVHALDIAGLFAMVLAACSTSCSRHYYTRVIIANNVVAAESRIRTLSSVWSGGGCSPWLLLQPRDKVTRCLYRHSEWPTQHERIQLQQRILR